VITFLKGDKMGKCNETCKQWEKIEDGLEGYKTAETGGKCVKHNKIVYIDDECPGYEAKEQANMIEDVKKEIYSWGIQKILEATSIETKEKAEEIVQKKWLETIQECSKPLNHTELKGLSKQKIEDWCKNNN
jgi:tagatose-1,6-bisphosphate aldolase